MMLKVIVALAFLIYSSILDLKDRRVPNKVWIWMLAALLPFTVYEVTFRVDKILLAVIGTLLVIALSLFFYAIKAYGGADAKALIVIALTFPFYPEFSPFLIAKGTVLALSTLTNSLIFTPFIILFLFVRNVLNEGFKAFKEHPLGFLIGYKVKISDIRHHKLLQIVRDGEIVNLYTGIDVEGWIIDELKKAGLEKVWVTPKLPFLVFITIGFLIAVTFGDLLCFYFHVNVKT